MAPLPPHLPLPAPSSSPAAPSPAAPAAPTASGGASGAAAEAAGAAGDHGVRQRGGRLRAQGVVQARGRARQAAAVVPERTAGAGGGPAAALLHPRTRVRHQALLRDV